MESVQRVRTTHYLRSIAPFREMNENRMKVEKQRKQKMAINQIVRVKSLRTVWKQVGAV